MVATRLTLDYPEAKALALASGLIKEKFVREFDGEPADCVLCGANLLLDGRHEPDCPVWVLQELERRAAAGEWLNR